MKHLLHITFLLLQMIALNASAQSNPPLHIITPTGDSIDGLPVMEVYDNPSDLDSILKIINTSFIEEIIRIYQYSQAYLFNTNQSDTLYPATLAVTNRDGGYARKGYILKEAGGMTLLPEAPYIDITLQRSLSSPDRLMSFTQLYPHEMGHILYGSLCEEDSLDNNTKNVDIHFFSSNCSNFASNSSWFNL